MPNSSFPLDRHIDPEIDATAATFAAGSRIDAFQLANAMLTVNFTL
jgi:hypothetical protein